MKLSRIGRFGLALVVSVAMGLGMTSCGGGTIGYMWVLGTQFNNIAALKIDDFTGNLTTAVGSPFPSGGTNPVMLALKSGGRYLYVLNQGSPNISLFAVGGDGILTFQESFTSQGKNPVWLTTDSTGNFLFVLDQQSPDFATTGNGEITAFSLDTNTGRPSLITNAQVKNGNGTNVPYFEVGQNPIQFRYSSSGCLYTLDNGGGGQNVFPYSVSSTNGQLTQPTNSTIALNTANATSVNVGGSFIYVTDAGSTAGGPGSIVPFTAGTACSLEPVTGGTVSNLTGTSNPMQTLTVTGSGGTTYLYVLNHSNTNTNYANSSISAFTILANGQLQAVGDTLNPYAVGSGPVCIVEDPTNQYLYTSNQGDGTVTGKLINKSTGQLSSLTRTTQFTAVGLATCLVVSGNTGL
jgi:6-phosphogluconolactonase (cycloisomerase 2 family)